MPCSHAALYIVAQKCIAGVHEIKDYEKNYLFILGFKLCQLSIFSNQSDFIFSLKSSLDFLIFMSLER